METHEGVHHLLILKFDDHVQVEGCIDPNEAIQLLQSHMAEQSHHVETKKPRAKRK